MRLGMYTNTVRRANAFVKILATEIYTKFHINGKRCLVSIHSSIDYSGLLSRIVAVGLKCIFISEDDNTNLSFRIFVGLRLPNVYQIHTVFSLRTSCEKKLNISHEFNYQNKIKPTLSN